MLDKRKLSKIIPYTPEWFAARIGVMTGSKMACLCAPKGIVSGGMTYIMNKVYEKITGLTTEKSLMTEPIVHGITNEPLAIKYYQKVHSIPMIITEQHIIHSPLFAVTPDGLIIRNEKLIYDSTGEFINCETLESKSYHTPSVHMQHVECKTPSDIKSLDAGLYWQCLSQMYFADVTRGNAIFFHPDFPDNSKYKLGHVAFSKLELMPDFKLLSSRIEEAENIFNQKLEFSQSN